MKKIDLQQLLATITYKPIGYLFILLLLGLCILTRCHHPKVAKRPTIETTVTLQRLHQSLYFTGIIQPLNETALTCPIDAVIEQMHFGYGQSVNLNDVILTLNSSELEKQYNDALTDYLKAKDSFDMAKARFNGTQELWDTGLISKNNYLSEKSSLNTARITLMQSKQKLSEMLKKMDPIDHQDLSKLHIAQFNKVRQALNGRHNIVHLKAPSTGILLFPPKDAADKTGHIGVGASVKASQVIALIGDMTGIHIEIDIPETDINKIHVGMTAEVTGAAMGNHRLKGQIISINTQAVPGSPGAAPSFRALVEVHHLNAKQRAAIKIGMSAAIELRYAQEKQLIIPIKAIKQDANRRLVTIRNANGQQESREVVTGNAEMDKVVIIRGLKPGETIVYNG